MTYIPDDDLEFEALEAADEERANAPEPGDDAYIAGQNLQNEIELSQEQLTDELREQGIYLEWEGPDDIQDE